MGALARLRRTYFGNAVSVRDFRVGLRGNRSALLLALYLFLLIAVSLLVYESSTSNTTLSQAQSNLRGFYAAIMGMVTFAACAIAAASGATAIVMEAQRRQLELVTMTAAPPRYLLVGKLISSFRYTWMVLILSLPVTAACVVLGGATWTSVVLSYVLISFFALLSAAIGLAISTYAKKPTGAVAWTFMGVALYGIASTPLAAYGVASGSGALRGSGATAAPFTLLLNPGAVAYAPALDTTTTLWGLTIPNIVLACGTILLFVRYLLHIGGLAISHRDTRTIARFRLDSLITLALVCLGIGAVVGPVFGGGAFRPFGSSSPPNVPTGVFWGWTLVTILIAVVPTISAYGFDATKRSQPDGLFRIRETLSGRPSGALPFVLLLVLVGAGAHALGFALVGAKVGFGFLGTTGFVLSFAVLMWAMARSASCSLAGAKQAATVAVAFGVLLTFGLLAFFFTATYGAWYDLGDQWWYLYPLRPLIGRRVDTTNLAHGTFLLLFAVILLVRAERRLVRNLLVPPVVRPSRPPVSHA